MNTGPVKAAHHNRQGMTQNSNSKSSSPSHEILRSSNSEEEVEQQTRSPNRMTTTKLNI